MINLLYVHNNKKWIQFKRYRIINYFQKKYHLKPIDIRLFLILWKFGLFKKKYVVFSSWRLIFKKLKNNNNYFKGYQKNYFLACVTSHSNLGLDTDKNLKNDKVFLKAVDILKDFKVVSVNSKILFKMLSPYLNNLMISENGVNSKLYIPLKKKLNSQITIGYVFRRRDAKNEILLNKVINKYKRIKFKSIIHSKNLKQKIYNEKEMVKFYNSIDFFICLSTNEGTPNPALEAASCGVPIISTKVGNMPNLIKNNINGFFTTIDINDIINLLDNEIITITESKYFELKKNIRNEICKNWDWKIKIKNFVKTYDSLIKE